MTKDELLITKNPMKLVSGSPETELHRDDTRKKSQQYWRNWAICQTQLDCFL